MSRLRISVLGARVEPLAVAPQLLLRLRVQELTGASVQAVVLRAQVRVDPRLRAYDDPEERRLVDLFGGRPHRPATMRPFLWTRATAVVQEFTGETEVDITVPCSDDGEVAGSRYLQGLGELGSIPLHLLFSSTVFTHAASGFSVEQVPWDREARHDLPVSAWRAVMDQHFPGQAWRRADRETIADLARYKAARAHATWEQTVAELLDGARAGAQSVAR